MRARSPPSLRPLSAAEKAGSGLADILIAGLTARMKEFIASFDGSPHVEEIFSEHLLQARDLYQKYAAHYAAQLAATIERVCRKQKISLVRGMSAAELARCVEMAMNGAKIGQSRHAAAGSVFARSRHHDAHARHRRASRRRRSRHRQSPWPAKKSVRRKNLSVENHPADQEIADEYDDDQRPHSSPARRSRRAADRRRARRMRSHRHQAGMRRRRVRRLHGAGRRRARGELPDARARSRGQVGDDGRGHRRRRAASGAKSFHGVRRAAMRFLHAGFYRGGCGLLRPLARDQGHRDAVARRNRRGAVGTSMPLRRL